MSPEIVVTAVVCVLLLALIYLVNLLRKRHDDTDRLNFLQDNRVRICHIDDKFGVIKDGMVLGIGLTGDLREAIDGARAEMDLTWEA
jgi:hypothetical protein